MAGYKNPKSICSFINPQKVDDGTMARMGTMHPGSAGLYEFARTAETDELAVRAEPAAAWDWAGESKWTAAADWPESLGTGAKILRSYKDGWVRGHREAIKKFASGYDLPAELLAGIAWIETGGRGDIENYDTQTWGDTEMLDQLNFSEFTTETDLEMDQIQDEFQRALEYLDLRDIADHDIPLLFNSLRLSSEGLSAAAQKLSALKDIDYPGDRFIGPEEMRVIAARYFRGAQWSLEEIESDFWLGNLVIDLLPRVNHLLQDHI